MSGQRLVLALIALAASGEAANANCKCSGQTQDDVEKFGETYGTRCAAWDEHNVDWMWPSYGPYERTPDSGDEWCVARH